MSVSGKEICEILDKNGTIRGTYYSDDTVLIKKGSLFKILTNASLLDVYKKKRNILLVDNYISTIDNQYGLLNKDFLFDSPSMAISCMMGSMISGLQNFYTTDNISLGEYIKTNITKRRKDVDLDDNIIVSSLDEDNVDNEEIVYSPKKPNKVIVNETITYQRDFSVAKRALFNSGYKCELDNTHITFITCNGLPYVEAHHLIPLSKQSEFEYSLDVEANIISLCPNCHRKLHYGEDISKELDILMRKRQKQLVLSGISIEIEKLIYLE